MCGMWEGFRVSTDMHGLRNVTQPTMKLANDFWGFFMNPPSSDACSLLVSDHSRGFASSVSRYSYIIHKHNFTSPLQKRGRPAVAQDM